MSKRVCVIDDCCRLAFYGPPGTAALLCNQHRAKDTVDLRKKTCITPGCASRPTHFYVDGNWTHCIHHHLPGMRRHKLRAMYNAESKPIIEIPQPPQIVVDLNWAFNDLLKVKKETELERRIRGMVAELISS